MRAAIILALLLAGCQSVDRAPPPRQVELASIPENLKRPCATPIGIPERDLYAIDETMRLWLQDRQHLDTCGKRHGSLVTAIEARDRIQGAPPPAQLGN
jgi:hypothetical protein